MAKKDSASRNTATNAEAFDSRMNEKDDSLALSEVCHESDCDSDVCTESEPHNEGDSEGGESDHEGDSYEDEDTKLSEEDLVKRLEDQSFNGPILSYDQSLVDDASSRSRIRLLHLLPGKSDTPLSLRLETVYLDEYPSFDALSYCWGVPYPTYPIAVSDAIFQATISLKLALYRLRLADKPRRLWVDAICINQSDSAEKSCQVGKMAEIYARAEKTIVWLGEEAEGSALAFKLCERMHKNMGLSVVKEAYGDDAHEALALLREVISRTHGELDFAQALYEYGAQIGRSIAKGEEYNGPYRKIFYEAVEEAMAELEEEEKAMAELKEEGAETTKSDEVGNEPDDEEISKSGAAETARTQDRSGQDTRIQSDLPGPSTSIFNQRILSQIMSGISLDQLNDVRTNPADLVVQKPFDGVGVQENKTKQDTDLGSKVKGEQQVTQVLIDEDNMTSHDLTRKIEESDNETEEGSEKMDDNDDSKSDESDESDESETDGRSGSDGEDSTSDEESKEESEEESEEDESEDIDSSSSENSTTEQQAETNISTREILALHDLLERPWFRRIWIVQEAAVSDDIVVQCGSQTIDWWVFLFGFGITLKLRRVSGRGPSYHRNLDLMSTTRLSFHTKSSASAEDPELELLSLLVKYRRYLATDARDKIFALYGLTNTDLHQLGLAPNYHDNVRDVYLSVITALITNSSSLELLSIPTGQSNSIQDLSSWIPRWDDSSRQAQLLAGDRHHSELMPVAEGLRVFSASGGSKANPKVQSKELVLQGYVVDKITSVSDIWTAEETDIAQVIQWTGYDPTNDPAGFLSSLKRFFDVIKSAAETTENWKTFGHTNDSSEALENFARTLWTDLDPENCVAECQEWLSNLTSIKNLVHALPTFDITEPTQETFMECITEALPVMEAVKPEVLQFQQNLKCIHILDRRLGWARSGRLCLLPKGCEPGDEIVLLSGGRTPFVVRRRQKENSRFDHVGETFVRGLMYGEEWREEDCVEIRLL